MENLQDGWMTAPKVEPCLGVEMAIRITTKDRQSAYLLCCNIRNYFNRTTDIKDDEMTEFIMCHELAEETNQSHIHIWGKFKNYDLENFRKRFSDLLKRKENKELKMGNPGYWTKPAIDNTKYIGYTYKNKDLLLSNFSQSRLDNIEEYCDEIEKDKKKTAINKIADIIKKFPGDLKNAEDIMKYIDLTYILHWDKEPPSQSRLKCMTLAIMKKCNIKDPLFEANRYDY